jgi:hypothetical protein
MTSRSGGVPQRRVPGAEAALRPARSARNVPPDGTAQDGAGSAAALGTGWALAGRWQSSACPFGGAASLTSGRTMMTDSRQMTAFPRKRLGQLRGTSPRKSLSLSWSRAPSAPATPQTVPAPPAHFPGSPMSPARPLRNLNPDRPAAANGNDAPSLPPQRPRCSIVAARPMASRTAGARQRRDGA